MKGTKNNREYSLYVVAPHPTLQFRRKGEYLRTLSVYTPYFVLKWEL
jgi:hypothetical protein